MMPGGSDETGNLASAATNSGVVTPIAVEVGGLQPFQVKGDPHSISQRWRKWKRAFELTWPFASHGRPRGARRLFYSRAWW